MVWTCSKVATLSSSGSLNLKTAPASISTKMQYSPTPLGASLERCFTEKLSRSGRLLKAGQNICKTHTKRCTKRSYEKPHTDTHQSIHTILIEFALLACHLSTMHRNADAALTEFLSDLPSMIPELLQPVHLDLLVQFG